jgi:acetyl esterase/lipase
MTSFSFRLVLVIVALATWTLPSRAEPKIIPDVVYGHKDGMALTFDVIQPEKSNGAAILWIQSGGWYSRWADPKFMAAASRAYVDKGYTMFIVRHGSAPKYTIPEAVADVRLSARFIRRKAKDWEVDPERIGVLGGSAGGHLALVLGTTGDDGNLESKDEILSGSSRVACVVALYPPTDLRDWVTDPPPIIKKRADLKPPLSFDAKLAPDVSPLLKVTERSAPTLMIHGDKDQLVPIEHSKKMLEALEKAKVAAKLITIEGAAHGFNQKQNQEVVAPAMMEWFEKYLQKKE